MYYNIMKHRKKGGAYYNTNNRMNTKIFKSNSNTKKSRLQRIGNRFRSMFKSKSRPYTKTSRPYTKTSRWKNPFKTMFKSKKRNNLPKHFKTELINKKVKNSPIKKPRLVLGYNTPKKKSRLRRMRNRISTVFKRKTKKIKYNTPNNSNLTNNEKSLFLN